MRLRPHSSLQNEKSSKFVSEPDQNKEYIVLRIRYEKIPIQKMVWRCTYRGFSVDVQASTIEWLYQTQINTYNNKRLLSYMYIGVISISHVFVYNLHSYEAVDYTLVYNRRYSTTLVPYDALLWLWK